MYSWLTTWLSFEKDLPSHNNVNAVYWFSGFRVNVGKQSEEYGAVAAEQNENVNYLHNGIREKKLTM